MSAAHPAENSPWVATAAVQHYYITTAKPPRPLLEGEMPLLHDAYLKWAQIRGMDLGEFSAVLLDEAQDTSDSQFAMLQLLAPRDHVSVTAVGDADQVIYACAPPCPRPNMTAGTRACALRAISLSLHISTFVGCTLP